MIIKRGFFFPVLAGTLLVNVLLFTLMERMATPQQRSLPAPPETIAVDFIRLKERPPPPEIRERVEPPEPEKSDPAPIPQIPAPSPKPVRVRDVSLNTPKFDLAIGVKGLPFIGEMGTGIAGGYEEAVPIMRTPPLYPPNALARKLEGTVQIAFTVAEDGSVVDPEVVYSDPPHVFDRSALHAIRKWKFAQKKIDGEPISWQTIQTIYYQLDN
ncbi:energy transducer TonB [Nitrosococcus oceani]|uniref:energy transducer TonB n=1 Tax=Nitrosococcus oceani TaxID=1229 RepID=UPI0004E9521B|nr:energy transducer TonB [Nitrosococcus oceani]KFI23879.1 hypothetical protein HW44_01775 [Nitrosococcus oceani]